MAAVPRIFHFVFGLKEQTEPFSLLHYLTLRSCLEVNRPDALRMHLKYVPWGPLWDEIRSELELCAIDKALPLSRYSYKPGNDSAPFRYAHQSDFLRLDILLEHGGVYADMDTLFVKPYPPELFEHQFVMGRETVDPYVSFPHSGGSLCNALFFSAPGATFGRLWRQGMENVFDGNWSRHSTFLPFEISKQYPDLIRLEPTTTFFHLDWTREGIRDLFERDVALPDNAYSLHLWAHLWVDRRRANPTRFHADRLTPGYVMHADTTFARLARRWMPKSLQSVPSLSWQGTHLVHRAQDSLAHAQERLVYASQEMRDWVKKMCCE